MPTPKQIEAMRVQVAQYDQERIDEANETAASKVVLAQALVDDLLPPDMATKIEEARVQCADDAPQLASVLNAMKNMVELLPNAIERGKGQVFEAIRGEQTGNGEAGAKEGAPEGDAND